MSDYIERRPQANPLEHFFGVLIKQTTYKRLGYLLAAFPLGIVYFVFLVTGISLGIGLTVIWVGLGILLGVVLMSYVITAFERVLAIGLLDVDIPPINRSPRPDGLLKRLGALLSSPTTWKGLAFQFLKFPLGILSFVLVVTPVVTGVAFVFAPLGVLFSLGNIEVTMFWWETGLSKMTEAFILSGVGVFLLPASLHLLNGFAWLQGQLAVVMLGDAGAAFEAAPSE